MVPGVSLMPWSFSSGMLSMKLVRSFFQFILAVGKDLVMETILVMEKIQVDEDVVGLVAIDPGDGKDEVALVVELI